MRSGSSKTVYVGDEMVAHGAEASYAPAKWWSRPIDRGIVVDWNLEQKIWDRGFHLAFQEDPKYADTILNKSFEDFSLL